VKGRAEFVPNSWPISANAETPAAGNTDRMTPRLSRKQFLRAGALSLAAGIAGCNAPATDSTTTSTADTDSDQPTDTATLSRWSLDRAWPTWGFGPAVGEPYDDVRYPVDHVAQLVASFPAYVSSGVGSGGDGGGRRGGQGSDGDGRLPPTQNRSRTSRR
jgi:hypothetical protein